jgi:membrane fusion protein
MSREASGRAEDKNLFRIAAVSAAGERPFGSVSAVIPPSAGVALIASSVIVAAISVVAIFVEVPLRAGAIGVLMPPGGFLDIIAAESGQVSGVYAEDRQRVTAGDLLLEISAQGSNVIGETKSAMQLRSLRTELRLLQDVQSRQVQITTDRLAGLERDAASTSHRLQIGYRQLATRREELSIIETRFNRRQGLFADGHIARDDMDRERAALMQVRASGSDLEQLLVGMQAELERLKTAREETLRNAELQRAEHALRAEKIKGEIELGSYFQTQGIRSPTDGVVARVLVRSGEFVRQGQVLAKLHKTDDRLEAWLYLSSSSARLLRKGQSVELQLDAWPQAVFGTRTAIVSSVSGIALLPAEVSVPLNLAGPVFEVRAILQENVIAAFGTEWPISPGTTFQAKVIQRRLKLYQWLVRALDAGDDGERA